MSGRSARTIRNFSLEVSPDLVLLNIRKSTFQHLTVNLNLNVLKWPSKSSILSRVYPGHLYYLFLDISPPDVSKTCCKNKIGNPDNQQSENLKIQKPRFINKCPEPHPTPMSSSGLVVPPHPTLAFPFNVMAFPFNVVAFPVTERSHGLGEVQRHLAMAWRRRQAMGTPSNWERHNIKWERHNIKWKRRGGVGSFTVKC